MGTAVANRTATAVTHKPIADVVRQIKTHIYNANNAEARCIKHRLAAGQLLLQLRQRIESGEEGNGIDWWEWFEKQDMGRSRKDCERLMRIASAEDPEQALEDEREKTRLAVAKHREKKAADLTVSSKPEPPRLRITDNETGKHRYATKAERAEHEYWMEANAQAWKATWLRCHPGRTGEDYDEVRDAQGDDLSSPYWRWRKAMGEAGYQAELAARQKDLPELPEHHCGMSDEQYAQYQKWRETYKSPEITVTMEEDEPEKSAADDPDDALEDALEGAWQVAKPEVRESIARRVIKESDPVALAIEAVQMMGRDQLRRFESMFEEYKQQQARGRVR